MKTTIDIHAELLARARRHARNTGRPLRAVVEDGLRRVLASTDSGRRSRLSDLRVGDPHAADPLETCSWPEVRELMYGEGSTSSAQPDSRLRTTRPCGADG